MRECLERRIRKENVHEIATVLVLILCGPLQLVRHDISKLEKKKDIRTIRKRLKKQGNDPREETHRLFWGQRCCRRSDGESRARTLTRNWDVPLLTINPLSHHFSGEITTPVPRHSSTFTTRIAALSTHFLAHLRGFYPMTRGVCKRPERGPRMCRVVSIIAILSKL